MHTSTQLKITGMTCGHCVAAVREALQGVPGASEVKVELETGRASVDGGADLEALLAAVREEGYQAVANP